MQNQGFDVGNQGDGSGGMNQEMPRALTVSNVMKEIQVLKEKFKTEDDDYISPYADLEKSTVLQECRIFSDAKIVTENPRKCCQLITKLLYILTQGETLSSAEATDVFFGVTKLFQSDDSNLRRLMYLFIKDLADACDPDDVIIVTASLTKEMNSNEDLYRANSIRVLAKIIDATMLGAIERYMKQAIVDKNPLVSSSALVAGMNLMEKAPEVVRRWVGEVQEAVHSNNEMVQFHGLCLIYQIKSKDRLAISKLVAQLIKGSMRSPMGICLLIRYIRKLLQDDMNVTDARAAYQFLESSLRHKNEMVIYEAARAICNLPSVEARDLNPAITVLQLFLSSPKPTMRFCAMRTLSEVSLRYPLIVVKCSDDMETLICDSNRSIATLAISTLLKISDENGVDRLMKQISNFMNDIGDEFKIVVVKSINQLCLKYPQKHQILVGFLATFLREEGGFEYKKAITDSIVELIYAIPETKESSLFHLCEFIEDCEFTDLSTQILHLIGALGPDTVSPARYIRFVFNRVILENAAVRAAAVGTLAKFAAHDETLRPSIAVLLKRSMMDEDDEVRDRVTMALKMLNIDAQLMLEPLPMSFNNLEKALKMYEQHLPATNGQALTIASLPVVEDTTPIETTKQSGNSTRDYGIPSTSSGIKKKEETKEVADPAAALYAIPEIAALGRCFRSTPPVELSESETEYVVNCVKYVFPKHIVIAFNVTNTIDSQKLINVKVELETDAESYQIIGDILSPELNYDVPGVCYSILERVDEEWAEATIEFSCELMFNVVEVDPKTGEVEGDPEGFDEQYPLENLEITTSDHMAKVSLGDFRRGWETIGDGCEVVEQFALKFKKLGEAVNAVIDFLGMQPCDGTAAVPSKPKGGAHNLYLSGVFVGNTQVLVSSQFKFDQNAQKVIVVLAVRSDNPVISRAVANCLG